MEGNIDQKHGSGVIRDAAEPERTTCLGKVSSKKNIQYRANLRQARTVL